MLRRRHLGRVPFAEANDFQHALLNADDDYLLLLEHPATYTRGVRATEDHFNLRAALRATGSRPSQ